MGYSDSRMPIKNFSVSQKAQTDIWNCTHTTNTSQWNTVIAKSD